MPCVDAVVADIVEFVLDEWGVLRLRECGGYPTGFLVAFEGLDGSGVSTHSRILAEVLRRVVLDGEYRVVYTKEPTGSPIGFLIWQIIRGYLPEGFKRPDILAHLFVADRLYHLYEDRVANGSKGVAEALASGYIVVMDRYKYSTMAYQATPLPGGRTLPIDYLVAINEIAPPPHILAYIDLPPEEAAKRIAAERNEAQLYESRERLALVRRNYEKILERLRKQPEWPQMVSGNIYLPPWYTSIPRAECIYGAGPSWPAIIQVKEANGAPKPLEQVAKELATTTIKEMIRRELLIAKT